MTGGDVTPVQMAFLLDYQNLPRNVLPDGTNDLTQYLLSCTWRANSSDDVERSADVVFKGQVANWIQDESDRIRLYHSYRDGAGNEIQRFPVGTFLFPVSDRDNSGLSSVDDTNPGGGLTYTAKLFDETWTLNEILFKNDLVPPRGIKQTCLIEALIEMDYRSPAQGGRAPSGIASPCAAVAPSTGGSPIGKSVQAFTVCSRSSIDGLWHSPAGPYGNVLYSSYDGTTADVLHPGDGLLPNTAIDSVTFAPYSPWTLQPMQAIPGQTPDFFLEPYTGLYFRPSTGEFSLPQPVLGERIVVDPYKKPYASYPGVMVQQTWLPKNLPAASPWNSLGTVKPPLGTFPNDYDGSGPYYATPGSTPVTTTGSTTLPSGSGILEPIGLSMWAQRYGGGLTTLVPAGTWSGQPSVPLPDPANPAKNWWKPFPVDGFVHGILTPYLVAGWVFAAGQWQISIDVSGAPDLQGTLSMAVDVYDTPQSTPEAGYVFRGTLTPGPSQSFHDTTGQDFITLTASGALGAFTPASGHCLRLVVKITTTTLTSNLNNSAGFLAGTINLGNLTFVTHPSVTVGAGVSYVPPPVPAVPLVPVNGPTGIPWPDTNRPALTPAGCIQESVNIPPSRVNIPDLPDVRYGSVPFNRKDSLMSALKGITTTINCRHVTVSQAEDQTWTTSRLPYYTDDAIPPPIWTFSNVLDTTDGKCFAPINERLIDLTGGIANDVFTIVNQNGSPTVIYSELYNDSADSNVSRARMHRTVHKIIEESTIGNQDEADRRTQLELQLGAQRTNSVTLHTHINPCLGPGSVVNLYIIDPFTLDVLIDSAGDGNPYFVESIEAVALTDGVLDMTCAITCSRTVRV